MRQKNIVPALKSVLERDVVLYHANTWSEDHKLIYIILKQVASMVRDKKTHHKTPAGKKPKLAEYFVMVQVNVVPTTIKLHGHTLGAIGHVMRSYCASCKAGCGMCYHRGAALWMQHLHWGEGRPTEKPATAEFCSWVPGCRSKRSCSTIEPVTNLNIEKLPVSNADAQRKLDGDRQMNAKTGLSARYDVLGDPRKWELISSPAYVASHRFNDLFEKLRAANT